MTTHQAVPTYKSRRKMMLGCGVYFPNLIPEIGDRRMPAGAPPPPKRKAKRREKAR
jgi:hypothetical protein